MKSIAINKDFSFEPIKLKPMCNVENFRTKKRDFLITDSFGLVKFSTSFSSKTNFRRNSAFGPKTKIKPNFRSISSYHW